MSLYVTLTKQQRQQQLEEVIRQMADIEAQTGEKIRELLTDKARVRKEIERLEKDNPPADVIQRAHFMANREQILAHLQGELRRIDGEHQDLLKSKEASLKLFRQREKSLSLELAG